MEKSKDMADPVIKVNLEMGREKDMANQKLKMESYRDNLETTKLMFLANSNGKMEKSIKEILENPSFMVKEK